MRLEKIDIHRQISKKNWQNYVSKRMALIQCSNLMKENGCQMVARWLPLVNHRIV